MTATKDKPLIADLSEWCGYLVHYWPYEGTIDETFVVDFRAYRIGTTPEDEPECEFSIKWDGCVNLSSDNSMHFCSHEGVRAFAAMIVKCFELAATLMPTRHEEFLDDGHHDDPMVMNVLNGKKP